MQTQIIPREEWATFFADFSRQHEGRLVTLEVSPSHKVFTAKISDQVEANNLALGGITAELNDDGDDRIEIMVGEKPEDHITHNIIAPTQISLEQPDEGADATLAIKSKDGATTILRF